MGPNIKLWEKNPVYSSCNYIHVLKYFNLEYLCHSFVLTLMYYWKLESLLYFGRYKYMYQFYSISHRFLLRLSQYNQVYVGNCMKLWYGWESPDFRPICWEVLYLIHCVGDFKYWKSILLIYFRTKGMLAEHWICWTTDEIIN